MSALPGFCLRNERSFSSLEKSREMKGIRGNLIENCKMVETGEQHRDVEDGGRRMVCESLSKGTFGAASLLITQQNFRPCWALLSHEGLEG